MFSCKIKSKFFINSILFYFILSIFLIFYIPFTKLEYKILNNNEFLTNIFVNFLSNISNNYIFLRLTFFILSIISIILLYKISQIYLKSNQFQNLSILVFIFTPGFFISSIIINYATLQILLILSFIYFYLRNNILYLLPFVLLFFTNTMVFILYLAIAIYSFIKKDKITFVISIFFIFLSIIFNGFNINGLPKGYFIELFISYSIVFSPFYFLALIYSLYRVWKDKNNSLLSLIISLFLISSFLLSIRQKINIINFTPYIIIAAPLIVLVFKNSISIRLKRFQKKYILLCNMIITVMLIETLLIAFSYPIYKLTNGKVKIVNSRIYTIGK